MNLCKYVIISSWTCFGTRCLCPWHVPRALWLLLFLRHISPTGSQNTVLLYGEMEALNRSMFSLLLWLNICSPKASFFSSIYSLLWLPWYMLYFRSVSIGLSPFSLGERKESFPEPNWPFYSVNMVIFACAEFPPVPFPFIFGVLLCAKGSFHPTFIVCI